MRRAAQRYWLGRRRARRRHRRLPRPVRLHRPHRGQGPQARPRDLRLLLADAAGRSVRQHRRGGRRPATTCWSRAFINSTILTVASRHAPRRLRRHGRLRAAAAARPRWTPVVNFLVLVRPDHPAGGRADHLGAAGAAPVQDAAGPDPGRGRLRPVVHACCCSAPSSRRSRASSTRRRSSTAAPGPALFFRVIFPLLRPVTITVILVAVGGDLQRLRQPALLPARRRERHRAADALQLPEPVQHAVQPAVHEHPADHHPAADHVHLLQPPDRRRADRRRGQGLSHR